VSPAAENKTGPDLHRRRFKTETHYKKIKDTFEKFKNLNSSQRARSCIRRRSCPCKTASELHTSLQKKSACRSHFRAEMVVVSRRARATSPAASAPGDCSAHIPKRNVNVVSAPHAKPAQESDIWATGIYSSSAERVLRTLIGPVFLLIATPAFVNLAALAAKDYDSDLVVVLAALATDTAKILLEAFPLPSAKVLLVVASFVALQLALFTLLPGKIFPGARAPSGFVPHVSHPPRFPATYTLKYSH
jgi:hypothetical protein